MDNEEREVRVNEDYEIVSVGASNYNADGDDLTESDNDNNSIGSGWDDSIVNPWDDDTVAIGSVGSQDVEVTDHDTDNDEHYNNENDDLSVMTL